MTGSHAPITNAVLLTLLPKLQRLSQFLEVNLNGQLAFIVSDDSTEYKDLLHGTLVAPTPADALEVAGIRPTAFPAENFPCTEGSQDIVEYLSFHRF
jgi:hypothetical protein